MKPETRMSIAAQAAALGMTIGGLFGHGGSRIVARNTRERGWQYPHQGKQEIARRLRQIERGQLTKSNGLVTP